MIGRGVIAPGKAAAVMVIPCKKQASDLRGISFLRIFQSFLHVEALLR